MIDPLRKLAEDIVKLVDYDIYKDILDEGGSEIATIMMMIQDWAMSDE